MHPDPSLRLKSSSARDDASAVEHRDDRAMEAGIRWEMGTPPAKIRNWCYRLAAMLLLTLPAAAQLTVGPYLRMNLNGNVGYSYAGDINQGVSDHGMGFTGNAFLTGSYYNPNFLNFNVAPYYNRDQSNSVYGSLTSTTGVSSNVNLFSGSHFPGSVSYNKMYNGISAFGVPGSDLGLAQHTNNQGLSFGWSALIPDLPTLNVTYAINDTSNSIVGQTGSDTDASKILNILSTYRWDGFSMTGQFTHRNDNAKFAEFLATTGGEPVKSLSSSNNYGATIQHALPFTGNFALSYNRLGYSYDYQDSYSTQNSGNSSTLNANAAFHPTNKLGVAFNTSYNNSLLGSVPQPLLNAGAPIEVSTANSFHSVLTGTDVFYQIFNSLGVHADVQHQQQSFLGQTYSATQFGGSANFNYDHSILKGLSFGVGVVDTAQQEYNTGVGFVGNLNYNRKFYGWTVGGNFSYSQNTQTALLIYTTSSYSYLASLNRKIGERKYLMVGYSGSHSGIAANSGTTSSADRIWTGLIYRGNALNVYYNKSNGLAIFSANGLVPVPTTLPTQVLTPDSFTSYMSKGWGASLAVTPVKRLIVTAAWAKSEGSTIDPTLSIFTNNTLMNTVMEYRLRKIYVNGGFTRLQQSVGTTVGPPLVVTSYYIGFSRWFNFF